MATFRVASVLFLGAAGVVAKAGGNVVEKSNDGIPAERVIVLESFDNPAHIWEVQNDPVMGGRSEGTFQIEDGLGKFEGQVVDVPFLQAPGFLQARNAGGPMGDMFPDISTCRALQIVAKSNIPYQGYRVSFGKAHAPGGKRDAYGYKASFSIDDNGVDLVDTRQAKESKDAGWSVVTIPFHTFTDFWDDATGDPIKTCQDNPLYCPDEKTLKNIERLALWAEGVAGKVSLFVEKIQAVGCTVYTEVVEEMA